MFSRIMFTIHRVLGTLLSVLFLMWFVSGIVMIYHGFPSAGRGAAPPRGAPAEGGPDGEVGAPPRGVCAPGGPPVAGTAEPA